MTMLFITAAVAAVFGVYSLAAKPDEETLGFVEDNAAEDASTL